MINPTELIQVAQKAKQNAYAPYSGFQVGAALLTKNGMLYTGTNVENASYGLTVCAERIAIFNAVADGQREFEALAVSGSTSKLILPCGACLQVMAEFCPELPLFLTATEGHYEQFSLKELFPMQFQF